jgi:membrane-anchored mycosin MYCP
MPPRIWTPAALTLAALLTTPATPALANDPGYQNHANDPAYQKQANIPGYEKHANIPDFQKHRDVPGYQKYYVAASAYQGSPETVEEVATRFLGSATRAPELRSLNAGRLEPDGTPYDGRSALAAGWVLALPWDAAGPGVLYGLLPEPSAKPACHPAPNSGTPTGWALDRIQARAAHATTTGEGILVAIVDDGVDPAVPALAGHLRTGANLATGTTTLTDCAGTGTAMATIILQVAPNATILPIAVDPAGAGQSATAIQIAVSAAAQVIALGVTTDLTDPAVRTAIEHATTAGTVVVTIPPAGDLPALPGRLQVTPVDARSDRTLTGPADLSAPGVDVEATGPGATGPHSYTGPQYAVAYVAGAAALVRAADPRLSGPATADRLRTTTGPDQLLDAARAVTAAPTPHTRFPWWWIAAGTAALAALLIGLRQAIGQTSAAEGSFWKRRSRSRS